jgi:hypothetical protein
MQAETTASPCEHGNKRQHLQEKEPTKWKGAWSIQGKRLQNKVMTQPRHEVAEQANTLKTQQKVVFSKLFSLFFFFLLLFFSFNTVA